MLEFITSTGTVYVSNWGYQLQDSDGLNADELSKLEHDLIVMDFSSDGSGDTAFSEIEISNIKDGSGGRTVAVSYISIGEASEFRDHWQVSWTSDGTASGSLTIDAPSWLGPVNEDWPESRKVRYWEDGWKEIIFNDEGTGWLDIIVSQGFDAAYLDIVDAYYFWAVEATSSEREAGDPAVNDEKDAAQRMIDFIVEMTAHARETNPQFFVIVQNGAYIIDALEGDDPARLEAFLDAVGAIGVEDIYFGGSNDENNVFNPDDEAIATLYNDFLKNGIPVLAVDYVNTDDNVSKFSAEATADGFLPYAASSRELDVMDSVIEITAATNENDRLIGTPGADEIRGLKGADSIQGLAGDDNLFGNAGDDTLRGYTGSDLLKGGKGTDHLYGGKGNDTLYGNKSADILVGGRGDDRLIGGKGDDILKGGKGADTFVFKGAWGDDKIKGFADGKDLLDFSKSSLTFDDMTITKEGSGVLVADNDGNSILLTGIKLSQIDEDDFIFG